MKTPPNPFAELLREVIEEQKLSQAEISRRLGIPSPHLTQMKQGKRKCTAEYDLRLSRFFGTSEGYWMRLQTAYLIRLAKLEKGEQISIEVEPSALAFN